VAEAKRRDGKRTCELVWGRVGFVDGIVIVSRGDLEVANLDRRCAEIVCGATWDELAQARESLDESIVHLIDDELEMAIEIAWDDYSYELEPRGAAKEKPPCWWPPPEWASQDAPITLENWLDHHGGPNNADWVDLPDEIKLLSTRSQAMDGTNLIEFDERRMPEIEVIASRLGLQLVRDDAALDVFQY
jgi:hypothetical protein